MATVVRALSPRRWLNLCINLAKTKKVRIVLLAVAFITGAVAINCYVLPDAHFLILIVALSALALITAALSLLLFIILLFKKIKAFFARRKNPDHGNTRLVKTKKTYGVLLVVVSVVAIIIKPHSLEVGLHVIASLVSALASKDPLPFLLIIASLLLLLFIVWMIFRKIRKKPAADHGNTQVHARRLKPVLLNINHLNEVLVVFDKYHYKGSDWFKLFLSLGLHSNTLDVIRNENSNNTYNCLTECSKKWLSQADSVNSYGGTSWNSLVSALRTIEEKNAADSIEREMIDPASQILQHYSDKLVFPDEAVQQLYTEGVLPGDMVAESVCIKLIRALRTAVSEDHNKLKVLAEVLLKFHETQSVAKELLDVHDKAFPQDSPNQSPETSMYTLCSGDQAVNSDTQRGVAGHVVHVNRTYKVEIDRLRNKFAKLFHNIAPCIKDKIPSVKELIIFVRTCRSEVKSQLEEVSLNFDDVMDVIRCKCSLINITLLEAVVDQFNVEKGKVLMSTYNESLDRFCSQENSLQICNCVQLRAFSSSPLVRETVKFILDWKIEEHTLNDIKDLMSKAFGPLVSRVEVVVIREGNSITLVCCAPHYLMESLLLLARENLDFLKDKGLMNLTIGYYTVYDQNEKEIVSLKDQLAQSRSEKDISEQKYASETDTLKQSVQEKESEIAHLKLALTLKEETLHYSLEEMKEHVSEADGLKQSIQDKDSEIEQLKQSLAEKEKDFETLHSSHEEMKELAENDTDTLRQSVQQKENEIQGLRLSLAEKEKEIETFMEEMKDKRETDQSALVTDSQMRDELQDKEKVIQRMTEQIERLKSYLQTKAGLEEALVESKRDPVLSFDVFLSQCPTVSELTDHVSRSIGRNWYQLGTMLEIDARTLNKIEGQPSQNDTRKTTKMFEQWLSTTPTATRKQVLEALRRRVVSGDNVAEGYEKYLEKQHKLSGSSASMSASPRQLFSSIRDEMNIPRKMSAEFSEIRRKFGKMFYQVRCAIEVKQINPEEMKTLLADSFPVHKSQFVNKALTSVPDILEVVREKCTLTDVNCLEVIVEQFDVTEAMAHLDSYKKAVNELCQKIISQYEALQVMGRQGSPLHGETLVFVLSWDPVNCTLADIRDIIAKSCEAIGADVQIRYIGGNQLH